MQKLDSNSDTSIITGVTRKFNDSINDILKNSIDISEIEKRGNTIDKTVLSRFGYLLVFSDLELLKNHPDLLLAASRKDSAEAKMLEIQREIRK